MEARFYLQFADFANPGSVLCESLDEAREIFADYHKDKGRRQRERVQSYWITYGGRNFLGDSPAGWSPDVLLYDIGMRPGA